MTQSRKMQPTAAFESAARPTRDCDLPQRLHEPRPVLLDGALGTELERRGLSCELPLWSARALLEAPDEVRRIHEAYIDAGSEIVTANTFRTQSRTLARSGQADRDTELTQLAVSLAREASMKTARSTWVAGSVAPLEDCYSPDRVLDPATLESEHTRHVENLARADVDLVLIETMIATREARAASSAAKRAGIPFAVSFACRSDTCLLSGETLEEGVNAIADLAPMIVAVNCLPPQDVPACLIELDRLRDRLPSETALGAYANLGPPQPGGFRDACSPARFGSHALNWIARGAHVVGGCCGTTPDSIQAVAAALDSPFGASNP